MDIIGNVYIDFFNKIDSLDGKSHLLDKFNLGGFINLFDNGFLDENNIRNNKFSCISQKDNYQKYIEPNLSLYKTTIQNIVNVSPSPKAIIFEYLNKRTSYVLFDEQIEIDSFNNMSKDILIYYGDKIKIKKFLNPIKKIFIDTAGNSEYDLNLYNNVYPEETIISISSEYLSQRLKERYLELGFLIISHNPKYVEVFDKGLIKKIENKFYINPEFINCKITGIGDKFFYLFAKNYSEKKISLYESIVQSQKTIQLHILEE